MQPRGMGLHLGHASGEGRHQLDLHPELYAPHGMRTLDSLGSEKIWKAPKCLTLKLLSSK